MGRKVAGRKKAGLPGSESRAGTAKMATPGAGRRRLKRSEVPPLCSALGGLVREERERRGWSQVVLAAESGVTQPTVSYLERKIFYPKLETIERLALALSWEPDALLAEARRRAREGRGEI